MAGSFKDLVVWQKAVALSKEVIIRTWKFPDAERFALGDQIRRAIATLRKDSSDIRAWNFGAPCASLVGRWARWKLSSLSPKSLATFL